MKLSVIVPVYNVQEYIEECIESIINQTIKDVEIVIVDDGSTDESIKRIKKFRDNRIKIIHQENRGLSMARNRGIQEAKGKYIAFIDSDDFIFEKECFQEMVNILEHEKSGMIFGQAYYYYDKQNIKEFINLDNIFNSSTSLRSETYLINALKLNKYHAPVCFNIYKKEILDENNFIFKENLLHEDEEFMPKVILECKKVSYYNKKFYAYRQRDNSITKKLTSKNGQDIINISLGYRDYLEKIENIEVRKKIGNYFALLVLDSIYKYTDIKVTNEMITFLKENSEKLNTKIRILLLKINVDIYRKIENIYRRTREVG